MGHNTAANLPCSMQMDQVWDGGMDMVSTGTADPIPSPGLHPPTHAPSLAPALNTSGGHSHGRHCQQEGFSLPTIMPAPLAITKHFGYAGGSSTSTMLR